MNNQPDTSGSLIYRYWAKASRDGNQYHLLPYHLLDVAAVGAEYLRVDTLACNRIAAQIPVPTSNIPEFIGFFLSLHDLGKFAESFQTKLPHLFAQLQGRAGKLSVPLRHDSIGKKLWDLYVSLHVYRDLLFPGRSIQELRSFSLAFDPFINAVTGHHGVPPRNELIAPHDVFSPQDVEAAKVFLSESVRLFIRDADLLSPFFHKEHHTGLCTLSWPLAGLAVLADWIASDHELFPFCSGVIPLSRYWEEIALPRARIALEKTRVLPPRVPAERRIDYLFPDFREGKYTPSELQQYASQFMGSPGPHLFIIEDATGSGKTEAALMLAQQLIGNGEGHGVYFALPTMATSNAMYGRILNIRDTFFENGTDVPVILVHNARHLADYYLDRTRTENRATPAAEDTEDVSSWLSDSRKKALLAPMGVGTVDQALLAVLPRRHQSLRFFGIWRNVLIVDEVHAYDPYMNELLKSLIEDHARTGGSSILLSATLPHSTRNFFIRAFCGGAGIPFRECLSDHYPLVTHVSPGSTEERALTPRAGTSRMVTCRFFEDEESVIDSLLERSDAGQCACWIRNTVRDAREGYHAIRKRCRDETALLFHAGYVLGDRLDREGEVIGLFGKESTPAERAGRILVATQVVEQSLDLDFDYMVTDLAPIDLVIQRAGRLHRHPRGDRGIPVLGIHAPVFDESPGDRWYQEKFPGAAFVYPAHGDLWLTLRVLRERAVMRIPAEARALIESVFGYHAREMIPPALRTRDELFRNRHRDEGRAMMNVIRFLHGYQDTGGLWQDDEYIPTRLAEPSVTLRLGIVHPGENTIRPLYNAGIHSWDMSQVSVRRAAMGGEIRYVSDMVRMREAAYASMRDRGRNAILIPLEQKEDQSWENTFSRDDGKEIVFSYSKKEGLHIHEK